VNPIRTLVEAIADRIHAEGDDQARAYGLTVDRLPWGRRRIYDSRIPVWLNQRRRRLARDGMDAIDRALAEGYAAPPGSRRALRRRSARRLA
jgi:hypothetical protein